MSQKEHLWKKEARITAQNSNGEDVVIVVRPTVSLDMRGWEVCVVGGFLAIGDEGRFHHAFDSALRDAAAEALLAGSE